MEVDKDNKPTSRWIIRNILLAIAFFAVLLVLTQMGLKAITRHNQVIIVPDLTGLSVGKLAYREDIATNNVLDQFIKGRYVAPGTEVEAETPVDLLLGLSPDENETFIPYLIGYTLAVARDNLFENSLNLGNVTYDETVESYQDSVSAIVYQQSPAYSPGAPVRMGTTIHLKLTTSQAKIAAR